MIYGSLDEDVKMSVVKFKKEKQKKLKIMCYNLRTIAIWGKFLSIIGAFVLFAVMVFGIWSSDKVKIREDNKAELKVSNVLIEYQEKENDVVISVNGEEDTITDLKTKTIAKEIVRIYTKLPKATVIGFVIGSMLFGIGELILLSFAFKHMEKFATNIYENDTPFTTENAGHVKRIAIYLIVIIVLSAIGWTLINLITGNELSINIGFDLIYVLFLGIVAYIFDYGCQIQKDSNGKIYGEEK